MSGITDSIWERFTVSGNHVVNGVHIADGSNVVRIEVAEFNNCIYQFPAFMPWKLYVKMATQAEYQAKELCMEFKTNLSPKRSIDKKKIYSIHTESYDNFLNFYQAIISAYIFSHSALEAYINFRLDSFQPTEADYLELQQLIKNNSKNGLIKIKTDLLKECSLNEKMFSILPYYFKKRSINLSDLKSFKTDFETLNFIRNELVHLKRLEIRTGQAENGQFNTKKFWNKIVPRFNKESVSLKFHPAEYITKVIKYIEEACANT